MSIKVIVLDLGRVLVELDFKRFIDDVISKSPLYISKKNEILNDFCKETLPYDLGNISKEEFFELSCKFLKIDDISEPAFFKAFNSVISNNNEKLIEIMSRLKDMRKFKLFLLSNVNPTHWEYGLKHKWNFIKIFDKLFLSFRLHMAKPDIKIFHHIIKLAKCEPEEILFIDDTLDNILAAKSLGIYGIQYIDLLNLINGLRELNFEV